MGLKWYAIHTQTGHEDHVKTNLLNRSSQKNCEDKISQVVIPMEKVSEVRAGKKNVMDRKFFPGYILVQMELNDDTWYLIKETPGVTGFIGAGNKPTPLDQNEVSAIIKASQEKQEKETPKIIFQKGENVRVKEGPFENFNGAIEEVNPEKGKLRVMVSIFGRTTPVELEYWQVERM